MLIKKRSLAQVFLASSTIFCLFLILWVGSKGVLGFLAFGSIFLTLHYKSALLSVRDNFLLFMFPIWAGVTVLWADYPMQALRLDIQLFMTFFISMSVIRSIPLVRLLEILCTLFSFALLSVLISTKTVEVFQTGEVVRVGVLGSKNNVSMVGAMSVAAGVMLLTTSPKPRFDWVLSVVVITLAIATILQAQSLGTFVTVLMSSGIGLLIFNMQKIVKSSWMRSMGIYSSILIMVALAILVFFLFSYESYTSLMLSLGKDPTITGRTFIWSIGLRVIEENFWTGVGLNSFWSDSNPDAVLIWVSGSREIGAAYGFHNLYIHTWVETGLPGFLIMCAITIKILSSVVYFLKWGCTAREATAAAFALFFVMKSFFEVPIFNSFSVNTFFFFLIWSVLDKPWVRMHW